MVAASMLGVGAVPTLFDLPLSHFASAPFRSMIHTFTAHNFDLNFEFLHSFRVEYSFLF